MPEIDIRCLNRRLVGLRAEILRDRPFYGRLLLRLSFGFSSCGTACTDMKHIIFDPSFANALNDDELKFILLHEVMHCVLRHCTRGKQLRHQLYNIACDIVVNSLILEAMSKSEFVVAGEPVMHLTPDHREGRNCTAEEVYEMLQQMSDEAIVDMYGVSGMDTHEIWQMLTDAGLSDAWGEYVREAAAAMGNSSGIPYGIQRHLGDIYHEPKTNWRQLLQDFIRHDRSDFTYQIPDRRFQGEFIFPSFQNDLYGDCVDRLWFVVDTSGSVSDKALAEAYSEIRGAVEQIDNLSGDLSFFDTEVTEPIPFESVEEIAAISPVGGGGTSFHVIFSSLPRYFDDELPRAVIILTDGYAVFPDECAAMGVPVLWIIIGSDVVPPWGECIYLPSD